MSGIHSEMKDQGFEVLMAAINPGADPLFFSRLYNVTFPVGVYDGHQATEYMQVKPGATPYVPMLSFLNRRGMIRAQFLGNAPLFNNQEAGVRALVKQLLAERPAGAPPPKKR
jgi:hypothetical protein